MHAAVYIRKITVLMARNLASRVNIFAQDVLSVDKLTSFQIIHFPAESGFT